MPAAYGPPWVLASTKPSNPAAGQPYTLTVPTGSYYHVLSVFFSLVTSGAAANRFAYLIWLDPTGSGAGASISTQVQVASLTYNYQSWVNIQPSSLIGGAQVMLTVPDLVAPETWQFQLNAITLQGADQIGSIVIFYEHLEYV